MEALNTPKQILKGFSRDVALMPGLSEVEIAEFQKRLSGPLPADIAELLRYSAGFDFQLNLRRTPVGFVRFAGGDEVGFPGDALPCPISLLGDGYGNYWVVDLDAVSGKWGMVFFICHDPSVIAVQAPDVATFLLQILDPPKSNPANALAYVRKEAVTRIWKNDPWLVSVHEARASKDPTVSNFATQLPENFRIADLRSREIGSGFSWGLSGPNPEVRRSGAELLFGVEQKAPSFLKRVLMRPK